MNTVTSVGIFLLQYSKPRKINVACNISGMPSSIQISDIHNNNNNDIYFKRLSAIIIISANNFPNHTIMSLIISEVVYSQEIYCTRKYLLLDFWLIDCGCLCIIYSCKNAYDARNLQKYINYRNSSLMHKPNLSVYLLFL